MKIKRFYLVFMTMLIMSLASGSASAAIGGRTIGGCIYTGEGTATYSMVGLNLVTTWSTKYKEDGALPINDAQVLIQNVTGGRVHGYGTMGIGGPNCWEFTVVDPSGSADVIALISAPNHAVTSREFIWDQDGRFSPNNWGVKPQASAPYWLGGPTAGNYVHPTGKHPRAGGLLDAAGEPMSTWAIGAQDAYLMTFPQKTVSDLHYVFYDHNTDGNDNGPLIDPPVNGVTVRVFNEDGEIVATQKTGELAETQGGFVTDDGVQYFGVAAYGLVYFRGLPGNDEYKIETDPSTVTQAANPHFDLSLTHLDPALSSACLNGDGSTGALSHINYEKATCKWYQTYTEEGTHAGEIYAWPGMPGTMGGGYLTWHGLVEKMPSSINPTGSMGNPILNGTITGNLIDATGSDPLEATVGGHGGRMPPTNARFENGTAWNRTRSALGWGGTPDPSAPPSDVIPNSKIMDGRVVLSRIDGNTPVVVGTAVATNPTDVNDPGNGGGRFTFTNVPPGTYHLYGMDKDLMYVMNVGTNVTIAPGQSVDVPLIYERWGARSMGFVQRNGGPAPGMSVKKYYKDGTTKYSTTTNANGWFLDPMWWETGQMGTQYVYIPDGANYRGKMVTEQFQDVPTVIDPPGIQYNWATHNSMNRALGYATHNYFVDLQIEDIPAGVGNLMGSVYNDHFSNRFVDGQWITIGNGVYDETEDRFWFGETVKLYNAPASGNCSELTETAVAIGTRKTGSLNANDHAKLGWNKPYTYPADEVGSMHAAPVFIYPGGGYPVAPLFSAPPPPDYVAAAPGTPYIGTSASQSAAFANHADYAPMPGHYEFRDIAPGNYCIRVIPKFGMARSPNDATEPGGFKPVTVTAGLNSRVDLGVNTTPPGSAWGIKMAGEVEGGVWDGMQATDANPTSLLFMDAIALFGSPVEVKDGNDYFVGVDYQGDTRCHAYNNLIHTPGASMLDPLDPLYDPYACRSTYNTVALPEIERRFPPGANRYTGNATGYIWNRWDPSIPAYWNNYTSMELGIGVSQGGYKFEAAWTPTLKPAGGGGVTADYCITGLGASSFTSAPWGAIATVTASDGYTGIAGSEVFGTWSTGDGGSCITAVSGQCTITLNNVQNGAQNVTFSVNNVVTDTAQPWYIYNSAATGVLNGLCKTSVVVFSPLPPPPAPQCSDTLDNDGDGLIDFPADLGCTSAADNDEVNLPQCSDTIDNDGDGQTDFPADVGCTVATDNDERNQCSDTIDNDGDLLIDFPADLGCTTAQDNNELNPQCSDTLDNDGDGLIDAADLGCLSGPAGAYNPLDNDEFTAPPPPPPPVYQCSDLIDNDGDLLIDMADPGCLSVTDNDETNVAPPPPGAPVSVHLTSLTGTRSLLENKMAVRATVEVRNNLGDPDQGSTVNLSYEWVKEGKKKTGPMSCVTNASGVCTTALSPWLENATSVKVTLVNVADPSLAYVKADNVGPTTITILK